MLIFCGMGYFVFLGADTPYWAVCLALFVQGLGMGMTMMPIMSAALATLNNKQVPDGSTLMNVVQQTASSIGTAVISVVLANMFKSHPESLLAISSNAAPEKYAQAVQASATPPPRFRRTRRISGSPGRPKPSVPRSSWRRYWSR